MAAGGAPPPIRGGSPSAVPLRLTPLRELLRYAGPHWRPGWPCPPGCAPDAAGAARWAAPGLRRGLRPLLALGAAPRLGCALRRFARRPGPSPRLRQPPGGPRCGVGGPGPGRHRPPRAAGPGSGVVGRHPLRCGPPCVGGLALLRSAAPAPPPRRPGSPLPCPAPAGAGWALRAPRGSSRPGAAGRPFGPLGSAAAPGLWVALPPHPVKGCASLKKTLDRVERLCYHDGAGPAQSAVPAPLGTSLCPACVRRP